MKYISLFIYFFFYCCIEQVHCEQHSVDYNLKKLAESTNKKTQNETIEFRQIAWENLPEWKTDNIDEFLEIFLKNCQMISHSKTNVNKKGYVQHSEWESVCDDVKIQVKSKKLYSNQEFLINTFNLWKIVSHPTLATFPKEIITGYYEPVLNGSRTRDKDYKWPIYKKPDDLINIDISSLYPELLGKRVRGKLFGNRVIPYDTRSQLEQSEKKPFVLLWVDNPIDAYLIQVQGSGRVLLSNEINIENTTIRLLYDDHNGYDYFSIHNWLITNGELPFFLDDVQTNDIRDWAIKHPTRVHEILNMNPSVIFFREDKGCLNIGPIGSYGIHLEAGRSVAVDKNFIPLGAPMFLSTILPFSKNLFNRFVFAHDTGSAIKGANRIDLFCGSGHEAGEFASSLKQNVDIWLLWPKNNGIPKF